MNKLLRRTISALTAIFATVSLATLAHAETATTSISGGTASNSIPQGVSGNTVLGQAGIGLAGGQIWVNGTLDILSDSATLTLYDVGSESHWLNQIRLGDTSGAQLTDDDDHARGSNGVFTHGAPPFQWVGTVTQETGVASMEFWGSEAPAEPAMLVANGQSPMATASIALAYLNKAYEIVSGPTDRILVLLEDGGADQDYDDYVGILEVSAGSAAPWGTVDLRIEARPIADPVQAFVTVTGVNGQPIGGLTASNMTVLADGNPIASAPSFALPPAQGDEHLSVVFAMDYSGSIAAATRQAMEDAVTTFIASMEDGDYAAIVKSNVSNPNGASVVQPFTPIGPGTTQLLLDAVAADYPGVGTNLYDAVILAVQQFEAQPLPTGPKAVLVLSDGLDNSSTVDVNAALAVANEASIPLFTIGVGETGETNEPILAQLATETNGGYFPAPTNEYIADAVLEVFGLLDNEYLLTFTSFNDCNPHMLEVRVTINDETASAIRTFVRCTPLLVPDLVEQTLEAATTLLSNAGLVIGSTSEESSTTVPAGSVIRHSPTAGTEVAPGSSVDLVLSNGPPPPGTVPNVVGLTQAEATSAITDASLVVGTVTQQSSSSVTSGSVISQNPSAGTLLPPGSPVDLVISTGLAPVAVPNVVGLTQAAATSAINDASLVVGSVTQQSSSSVASGRVISQSPSAGTQVAPGSSVNLVVSSGPPPTPTPTPSSGGGGSVDYLTLLMLLLCAGVSARPRTRGKSLH